MPRTSKAEIPGCPPVRLFTADELGYLKVVECQQAGGALQVVRRWGEPDRAHGALGLSFLQEGSGMLAVARKNRKVDIMDGLTGACLSTVKGSSDALSAKAMSSEQDLEAICSVQLLGKSSKRPPSLLTCTAGGTLSWRPVKPTAAAEEVSTSRDGGAADMAENALSEWNVRVGGRGAIASARVDEAGAICATGGKDNDVVLWSLETKARTFSAKNQKTDNLGIFKPPWVTSISFLSRDSSQKVVVGTGHHEILLYDAAAQRRPVMKIEFGESPVRAVTTALDGCSVYAANSVGSLARFDMRTGGMTGTFKGASAGSVRSVALHPQLPLLASCGLDGFLRVHHTSSRQLLGKVFLKQPLTAVQFDTREDAVPVPAPDAATAGAEEDDLPEARPRILDKRQVGEREGYGAKEETGSGPAIMAKRQKKIKQQVST